MSADEERALVEARYLNANKTYLSCALCDELWSPIIRFSGNPSLIADHLRNRCVSSLSCCNIRLTSSNSHALQGPDHELEKLCTYVHPDGEVVTPVVRLPRLVY